MLPISPWRRIVRINKEAVFAVHLGNVLLPIAANQCVKSHVERLMTPAVSLVVVGRRCKKNRMFCGNNTTTWLRCCFEGTCRRVRRRRRRGTRASLWPRAGFGGERRPAARNKGAFASL